MPKAFSIKVQGVVQGVGFRPFAYRLASANGLTGWVLNAGDGVEIHLEEETDSIQSFLEEMKTQAPQAAAIADILIEPAKVVGFSEFFIQHSTGERQPTVRISPDLPICTNCLQELFDPQDLRYQYSYINCTNCGPRYSIIRKLPYDRPNTSMADWPLDVSCTG